MSPSPPTVRDLLRQGEAQLERRRVAAPRWSAQVLLEEALGRDLAWLWAHSEQGVSPAERRRFGAWIARRSEHEPVWYILRRSEFYGLEFIVNRSVLIPRHETELLVDCALELGPLDTIADACTGSGCIAVALAAKMPRARVFATDSSPAALRLARRNAARHGVASRITFLKGDWLEPLREPVDLVIANPPYVSSAEMPRLPREVRCYEPRAALHAGKDGMDGIRALLEQAPGRVKPGGAVIIEVAPQRARRAVSLARRAFRQADVQLRKDYSGRSRVLLVRTAISGSSRG